MREKPAWLRELLPWPQRDLSVCDGLDPGHLSRVLARAPLGR